MPHPLVTRGTAIFEATERLSQKGPCSNPRVPTTGLVAFGNGSKPSTRLRKGCTWPHGANHVLPDEEAEIVAEHGDPSGSEAGYP